MADINQEVYGLPEWLLALQSALLNESATLFRRKYYQNGSHAGFIDASEVWAVNELEPEKARLLQINDWLGEEVVRFRPYEMPASQ